MSRAHIDDFDFDQADDARESGDIATALHTVGSSFGPAVPGTLYAGALHHARRQRRRSLAAGTLATVAVLGVVGAVVTQWPASAGPASAATPAGPAAGTNATGSAGNAGTGNATAPTANPSTAKPDPDALGKLVLTTAMAALPAGSHPVFPVSGVRGPKPAPGIPSTIYASAFGSWAMAPGLEAPEAGVDVHLVTKPATCAGFKQDSPEDTCTDTPFAQGGHVVHVTMRKDPDTSTGPYLPTYTWVRPDGAEIEVSLTAPSLSQLVWTTDQVNALFAQPVWDQAVGELRALVPLPSS